MITRNSSFQPNRKEFGPALKRLDRLADQLQSKNQECLIPCRSAGDQHNAMNNCHVIAEGYLDRIGNDKKQVYCWPASARTLSRLVWNEILAGQLQPYPPYILIPKYPPTPRAKNHKDIKYTFACKNHDNTVFRSIDTVAHFNADDPETQLLLALRAVSAYTAFYQGHQRYVQHDFGKDPDLRRILAEYPQTQPLAELVRRFGNSRTKVWQRLEQMMRDWQTAYTDHDTERVASCVTKAHLKLRIAGTGIHRRMGRQVAVTILPDENYKCTIIATTLSHRTPVRKLTGWIPRSVAHAEANNVKERLQNTEPAKWLAWLVTQWEFLYASPCDYDNDGIISAEGRNFVEQSAASKMRTDLRRALGLPY